MHRTRSCESDGLSFTGFLGYCKFYIKFVKKKIEKYAEYIKPKESLRISDLGVFSDMYISSIQTSMGEGRTEEKKDVPHKPTTLSSDEEAKQEIHSSGESFIAINLWGLWILKLEF